MTSDLAPDGGYERGFVASTRTAGGRSRDVIVLARTEYRRAVSNGWALALAIGFAGFSMGLVTFSGAEVGPTGIDRLVASLAVLAVYLVPLAALVFGYDTLVGAEEIGWLQTLFALPMARWRVAIGMYLGRAAALGGAVVIGFGLAGLVLFVQTGPVGWEGYAVFLVATVALALVFLGIAVCISAATHGKARALGSALLVWAWFVLVHDLLALGVVAAFRLPDGAIAALLIANPADVYRVLVLGVLGASGDAGFASVMAASGLGEPMLILATLAWIVVPVVLAARIVGRRRL